ncbi:membrane protein containing DUF6, transmembrane [Candidatus Omnitrophus magneticus]|uniref:Membrane protein containing DUF6, transmembrane n=1 Tax=Candidatus Omnitrophus magneticus TaxID=1609969 RepID=A0A0F0CX07_9BACT|nr:membrane protein containing DUF6, transmembrane [Candidatus Omnitrophus magneticus]
MVVNINKLDAFLLAVLAALIWGIVPVLEKIGMAKISPFTALFYRCVGVFIGAFLLLIFIIRPEDIKAADTKAIALLILSGFLASVVATIAFYHALKAGDISKVVPIGAAYPLVSFILGIAILHEQFTLIKVAGVVLITCGIWLLK